jgi:hypothetical protein
VNRPFVHYRLSSQFDRDNCLNVPCRDNPIQGGILTWLRIPFPVGP